MTRRPRNITVVIAPDLRPSVPVAIDTDTWREKTENGWARFDNQAQLETLRRSISSDLEERAQVYFLDEADETLRRQLREAGPPDRD
jgi:hypothetical protein